MHDYPLKDCIMILQFKHNRMMNMHSKYDNMHRNGMFYALICFDNHILNKHVITPQGGRESLRYIRIRGPHK